MAASIRINILGDASGLGKAAKDAEKSLGSLDGTASKVGGRLAAAFAGVGVAAFAKQAVTMASNVGENLSKLTQLVGDSSKEIEAWSRTTAKSLGIAQVESLQAAGDMANLFQVTGKGGDEIADMSMKMVQLAGDMASFNDASPAETLAALGAGLRGESEPLRRFGVALDEATLKQKALSMGLISDTTAVLPPAIKMQAAYAVILEQTAKQQGDAERTADSLSNRTRQLSASFKDAQTRLGAAMIPAAESLVTVLGDAIPIVEDLAGRILSLGGAFDVSGEGMLRAAAGVGTFIAGAAGFGAVAGKVGELVDRMRALQTVSITMGGVVGVLGAVFTGAVALGLLNASARAAEAKRTSDELTAAFRAQGEPTQAMVDRLRKLNDELSKVAQSQDGATKAATKFGQQAVISRLAADNTTDVLNRIGLGADKATAAINETTAGNQAFLQALTRMEPALNATAAEAFVGADAFGRMTAAQRETVRALLDSFRAGEITREEFHALRSTLGAVTRELVGNREEFAAVVRQTVENSVAAGRVEQAWVDQTKAIHANLGETEMWIAVGAELDEKLGLIKEGSKGAAEATDGLAGAQSDAAQPARDLTKEIEAQAKALEEQREALLASFDKEVAFERQQRSTKKAMDDLAAAEAERNRLVGDSIPTTDDAIKAQNDYEEALLDARGEALQMAGVSRDMAASYAEASGKGDAAAAGTKAFRDKLVELRDASANGALRAELDEMIAKIDLLAWGFSTAEGNAARLIGLLRSSNIADVAQGFAEAGNPLDLPISGLAAGGPAKQNTPYVVGEQGPELFVPNGNGTIIPNDKLGGTVRTAAAATTGPVTYNIEIRTGADPEAVVAAIERYRRRNGGLPW